MINRAEVVVTGDQIRAEIDQVLAVLGTGRVASVSYDTAWVARLAPMFPNMGFEGALPWLRDHQHEDGSWGADVVHHHDRYICTLAAIIALRVLSHDVDEPRIRRGEKYMWANYTRINQDAHDTIGFPVLAVSLIEEAKLLGMNVPWNPFCNIVAVDKKLLILRESPHLWRKNTMSFSLEAIRACFPSAPDFLENNGSVGTSPAATASVLMRAENVDAQALKYLQQTVLEDGGIPNVSPIDTFEAAWSLNYLRLAGAITPDQPAVKRILNWLKFVWSPRVGLGFSSFYSVPNLDDTSVSYAMLKWAGHDVSADIFGHYEEVDHFRCFPGEMNPSLSAHLRMVAALRMDKDHPNYDPWIVKALTMLEHANANGNLWFDKWHASPYYLACISTHSLLNLADSLVVPHINWILSTQNTDGGWGYFGWSTPEETAYALMSLLEWNEHAERVDPEIIQAAGNYLIPHMGDQNLTSLWVGKCLYTPTNVVRSVILAALFRYSRWCDEQ